MQQLWTALQHNGPNHLVPPPCHRGCTAPQVVGNIIIILAQIVVGVLPATAGTVVLLRPPLASAGVSIGNGEGVSAEGRVPDRRLSTAAAIVHCCKHGTTLRHDGPSHLGLRLMAPFTSDCD